MPYGILTCEFTRLRILDAIWRRHQSLGLLIGTVFFCTSLTPSMMPRDPLMQGLLGGVLAIIGYEIGRILVWIWRFAELPELKDRPRHLARTLIAAGSAVAIIVCLWKAAEWQNITRYVVGLEPLDTSAPLSIGAVALAVAIVLWALLRAFGLVLRILDNVAKRFVPQRIGWLIAFGVSLWLFWAAIDGALVQSVLRAADASFEAADILIEPDQEKPADPKKTGSVESLIAWKEMGRWGRSFVGTGPGADDIATFYGPGANEPVRVYVGRRSAETAKERAELALQELIRVGGFERSNLVVMVPVGTGWMDPGSHDSLEFILGGDVATVAVQYSYLTSALSLMTNPEYGTEQSAVLFRVVYNYWRQLPPASRPKFYVHGLSQGAFNSQATLSVLEMLGDPIDGAFWAGSPFFSRYWAAIRDRRNPDTPAWRPQFGDGSLVRSMTQDGGLDLATGEWGPMRIVFLNYGSDPIVVFTFDSALRRPAWMQDPRPPDVSEEFLWVPVVTMFQIALDMAVSLEVPRYGHFYVAEDYIDGWVEVLDPPGWNAEKARQLKALFKKRGPSF